MYAQDCATSHDNRRGGVRLASPLSNAAVVQIWDLTTTTPPTSPLASFGGTIGTLVLKSGEQTDLSSGPFGYRPSDRIEMSNDWCVSIGTGGTNAIDETYIEVLYDIGSNAPIFIDQFQVGPTSNYDATRAGFAHDVAIPRNANWAVVNSQNWIHCIRLDDTGATPTATRTSFNIGSNLAGPCSPNGAVDSVAVTDDYAVVTTARPSATWGNRPTTWVYIVALTGPGAPTIVLEHELAPPATWLPGPDEHDGPHDVVITPTRDGGGTLAIVTTVHATGFYDLPTKSFIASDFNPDFRRAYQWQVDSVEATAKHAVVMADRLIGGATSWAVKIYELANPGMQIPTAFYNAGENPPNGDRPHDLAIDWDLDIGVVRTSVSKVVLPSLMNPPPLATVLPSTSNAHAYHSYSQTTGRPVFSSDSVVVGAEENGSLYAVTIGASRANSQSPWTGTADIIDLMLPVLSVTPAPITEDANEETVGCIPLDLAINTAQTKVVIRSTDDYDQGAPSGDGPDVVIIPLSGGMTQRFGGSGTVFGVDSLAAPSLVGFVRTNRVVLSVAQDPLSGGSDYTHVVK